MKRIVSVSIGSSSRDHRVETKIMGEDFLIERIGTDGDINKAIELIKQLDGKVDVFGMGGIDVYLYGRNNRKYVLRASLPILKAARKTPIVDGSGLKNTLERRVVEYINNSCGILLKDKVVLLVCAMDRFGMAEAFTKFGSRLVFGDVMFALGLPIPIRKLKTLHGLASVLMPVVSRLPFEVIYPTGKSQEETKPRYEKYYKQADIISGDFLYIKKYMPNDLSEKIIVTNTVTREDIDMLKARGVKILITSTPELDGRSFGTNVMEAVMVSLSGIEPERITPEIYEKLLTESGFQHRVEYLYNKK